MTTRTRLAALGLAAALLPAAGCALPGGDEGTRLTVYFDRATSFYEGSHVKVMGIDVGTVEKVEILADRVRVQATVDADVPLPAEVKASIVPLNLVGERNLVLYPAYSGGPKARSGHVIEREDTTLPIETDEALAAFSEVLDAIDPTRARKATRKAAESFEGNGEVFNQVLQESGRLTETLGGQADSLAGLAENLSVLSDVVKGREDVLGDMIEQLSTATSAFARERAEIEKLVKALVRLVRSGDVLLAKYEGTLVDDIHVLTQATLVLKGNSGRLEQLVGSLPEVAEAFLNTWDPKSNTATLKLVLDPALRNLVRQLGVSDGDECILPQPAFANCKWED
ncbi:MlaD family protein [Actinocorallia populi]|uniref:MlaD family protein n=1 Tax=Actinocorallia populi TaxID=2079200 RepID=UPI000D088F79|nr:MlaD family protein [Actinocorallia populi]